MQGTALEGLKSAGRLVLVWAPALCCGSSDVLAQLVGLLVVGSIPR